MREFDTPVDAVHRAYADPSLAAKWLGPDGYVHAFRSRDGMIAHGMERGVVEGYARLDALLV